MLSTAKERLMETLVVTAAIHLLMAFKRKTYWLSSVIFFHRVLRLLKWSIRVIRGGLQLKLNYDARSNSFGLLLGKRLALLQQSGGNCAFFVPSEHLFLLRGFHGRERLLFSI